MQNLFSRNTWLILLSGVLLLTAAEKNKYSYNSEKEHITLVELQLPKQQPKDQQNELAWTNVQLHKNNFMLESEKNEMSSKMTQLESKIEKLNADLKLQQENIIDMKIKLGLELNTTARLTRENIELKNKLQNCQADQFESLEKKLTSLESTMSTKFNEIKTVIDKNDGIEQELVRNETEILANIAIQVAKTESKINALNEVTVQKIDSRMTLLETIKTAESASCSKLLSNQEIILNDLQFNSKLITDKFIYFGITDLNTETINGKRYFFSFDQPRLNWSKANDFCRHHSMELVSIETKEEWNALKEHVKKVLEFFKSSPWSSARWLETDNRNGWTWTASGSSVTYNEFQIMKDATTHNCLYIFSDYWSNRRCSELRPFICEINTHFKLR